MPIWLTLLLSWGVFAIALYICDNKQVLSFHSEIAFYIFCAPVVLPIFAIGFPIAFCIRWFRKLKYFFETKRRQKKLK